jgi:hypothetical protein
MAGPFESAGAIHDPTRYAALTPSAEQFAGLRTQRSPYSDGISSYLMRRFYSGIHFDQMLDGLNREISVNLTDKRRPGTAVYNAATFPPTLSFFSFKSIQDGIESVRVLLDGTDGNIWDATAGTSANIFTKSAGAGPMCFMNVNTELFMGDGVDQKKWLNNAGWQASTNVLPGTLINVGTEPGNMQMALGGITLPIVATQNLSTSGILIYFDLNSIPDQFANLLGASITFSGLTNYTSLNGQTKTIQSISSSTLGCVEVPGLLHAAGPVTPDTGQATTGNGITGATPPSFSGTQYAVTADGGQQWKCYGTAVENWGLPQPTQPTVTPYNGSRFWQANATLGAYYSVLDPNQNLHVIMNYTGGLPAYTTGLSYPKWNPQTSTNGFAITIDGNAIWWNFGIVGVWSPVTAFGLPGSVQTCAILDSNQNLQVVTNGTGGNSGGSPPTTWATTIGTTTSDGALTWTCVGPGVVWTTASISYSFSTHAIDGSVSTASLPVTIQGGILGKASSSYLSLNGTFQPDTQIDQIWIWRTPQGESTLILEDQYPIDLYLYGASSFTYAEQGIPDTSTNGARALNAFIAAPVASANNPPPAGITGMANHLQRTWGFVGNLVYYSGGPDTLVGNGNTAWPPLNFIAFIGKVIKLRPITVQNGGILVYTTSGIWIILGIGTSSNPFYTTKYADKIILGGYNVEDVLGTEINLMESNGRVSSLTVTYPFNPQSGYNEVGLPIGDQFLKVTTGGISAALYNPATSYLSWNIANTRDVGMYVADGAVGWFRMGAVSPPESGLVWSPRAAIAGGTSAVQSVEVSPGVFHLLIGPPTGGGPILMRDVAQTAWADNGNAYPAWDTKGVIPLCSTGAVSEVAWIAAKSAAVGSRPVVSVLMGEIAATANTPWTVLQPTAPDPADQPPSQTVYSDRYSGQQGAAVMKSDSILLKFDYGSQAAADELLEFAIYGAKEEERKQQ